MGLRGEPFVDWDFMKWNAYLILHPLLFEPICLEHCVEPIVALVNPAIGLMEING